MSVSCYFKSFLFFLPVLATAATNFVIMFTAAAAAAAAFGHRLLPSNKLNIYANAHNNVASNCRPFISIHIFW